MNRSYKRFYLGALSFLLLISAYPLINGVRMMYLFLVNGAIGPEHYARYVIPYAPMCFALIMFAALQPVWPKIFKRITLAVSTIISFVVFVMIEVFFEGIKINTNGLTPIKGFHPAPRIDAWQAFSCYISPNAIKAMSSQAKIEQDGFYYIVGNNTYKIHYYLVALVIIVIICSLIYGYGKMFREKNKVIRKPLALQAVSAVTLVGLCVLANMTGFFRDTAAIQNPTASILTCLFFIVLGSAAGIYAGSFLLEKSKALALWLPVLLSIVVCIMMYVGEAAMMDGNLYRFGVGWFFAGIPGISVAIVDLMVIMLSAVITVVTLHAAKRATYLIF